MIAIWNHDIFIKLKCEKKRSGKVRTFDNDYNLLRNCIENIFFLKIVTDCVRI